MEKLFYLALFAVVVLSVILWKSIRNTKHLQTYVLFSMTQGRHRYLTRRLSQIQQKLLELCKTDHSYYKVYHKHEYAYFAKILDWLDKYQLTDVSTNQPLRVLDIGCAYGTLLAYIHKYQPDAELCGTDFVDYYFPKELSNEQNIHHAISNIETEELPFNTHVFDVIILTEVLEHFNYHPADTLRKIYNLLDQNGVLYLSTPDSESGWGKTTKYYNSLQEIPSAQECIKNNKLTSIDDHVWQYNLNELLDVLTQAGFKVQHLEYTYSARHLRHFNLALRKASKS